MFRSFCPRFFSVHLLVVFVNFSSVHFGQNILFPKLFFIKCQKFTTQKKKKSMCQNIEGFQWLVPEILLFSMTCSPFMH
jgi:hypothetical protein